MATTVSKTIGHGFRFRHTKQLYELEHKRLRMNLLFISQPLMIWMLLWLVLLCASVVGAFVLAARFAIVFVSNFFVAVGCFR